VVLLEPKFSTTISSIVRACALTAPPLGDVSVFNIISLRVSVSSSESSRAHRTGRERMGSPTLQRLQGPILLPWVCFRGGGFPFPSSFALTCGGRNVCGPANCFECEDLRLVRPRVNPLSRRGVLPPVVSPHFIFRSGWSEVF
jgi:hypothetical protein